MKQVWSVEELVEQWSFSVEDHELRAGKHASGRLGFAAQFAFYRLQARFPTCPADLAPTVVAHLADQVGVPEAALSGYDWDGRSGRRHRQEILAALGVRPFDGRAEAAFRAWLLDEVMPTAPTAAALEERIRGWVIAVKVEYPAPEQLQHFQIECTQALSSRPLELARSSSWLFFRVVPLNLKML